jgi:transcription antitermination factor NusG
MIKGTVVSIVEGTFKGFSGVVVGMDYVAPNGKSSAQIGLQNVPGTTPVIIKIFGIPVVVNFPTDILAVASKDGTDYKYVADWAADIVV